mmetsp:Transcript_1711/g.3413  ORF Transcript_1711/g.3413 Transcript_1711/m.3413 type:complete len:121 (+) Transcript_1711:7-369(+)
MYDGTIPTSASTIQMVQLGLVAFLTLLLSLSTKEQRARTPPGTPSTIFEHQKTTIINMRHGEEEDKMNRLLHIGSGNNNLCHRDGYRSTVVVTALRLRYRYNNRSSNYRRKDGVEEESAG